MRLISIFLLASGTLLLLNGCDQAPQQPDAAAVAAASGAYKTCAACHGAQGQGNAGLKGPALVNLEGWYLKRQLQNFRDGIRGRHPKDIDGMMMAGQAAMLKDDAAIVAVVAQIDSFQNVEPLVTLKTEIGNGKETYQAICGACHGVDGTGNELMNAPSLRGIDDWYLVGQYEKFREGIRGAHEEDIYGQQMQRMGHVLTQDESERVVAWLVSLGLDE